MLRGGSFYASILAVIIAGYVIYNIWQQTFEISEIRALTLANNVLKPLCGVEFTSAQMKENWSFSNHLYTFVKDFKGCQNMNKYNKSRMWDMEVLLVSDNVQPGTDEFSGVISPYSISAHALVGVDGRFACLYAVYSPSMPGIGSLNDVCESGKVTASPYN